MDSPLRSTQWAPWMSRSRMASATVASPTSSCQRAGEVAFARAGRPGDDAVLRLTVPRQLPSRLDPLPAKGGTADADDKAGLEQQVVVAGEPHFEDRPFL